MLKNIEVKLTAQEVQAIITALKNVSYDKCNFKGKEELIEKLKGKSNTMYRNKWDITDHIKEWFYKESFIWKNL